MADSNVNAPLVAVGVPVYNGGPYLKECLDSILNQTYQNWECVIIDNQSKDDTNKIAQEFVDQDSRFKLIVNEEFVDQTTNWNISYQKSSDEAKYFKIVCADDWLFPTFLEKMVPILEANSSVGFCSSYRIDGVRVRCDGLDYYGGNYYDGKDILIRQLKNQLDITGSINTLLYRKETLKNLDYYPEIFQPNIYHIDTILAYDVLAIANFGFVFEILSYTRRHNETYTSTISNRYRTDFYGKELLFRKFRDQDPSFSILYKKIRSEYAYFLFKSRLKNNKDCLNWHKKHLTKKFTASEYLKAFLTRNIIARQFKKVNLKII